MADAAVIGFGAYVPERVMKNDEWADYVETSDEWITTRTGIKARRIAAPHESTADLALVAGRRAVEDAGLGPADVDEIIVATDTPETYSPDTAAYIQDRLGAREVPAYDLGGSGCAGFVLALDIARSRAHGGRNILVIGVEMITRLMDWTDRNTCVLFGDAAGAVIVSGDRPGARILSVTSGTDGTQAAILGLPTGGTRRPFDAAVLAAREHQRIVMDGREVFRNAVRRMSEASADALELAGVSADDIALVIPHQANLRIIDAVRKAMSFPEDRVYINVQDYGNTGSASVPLALWEARDQGLIGSGDKVLLTAFGAGFHWAAAVLEF